MEKVEQTTTAPETTPTPEQTKPVASTPAQEPAKKQPTTSTIEKMLEEKKTESGNGTTQLSKRDALKNHNDRDDLWSCVQGVRKFMRDFEILKELK